MGREGRITSLRVFKNYNSDYELMKRSILLSGECITRKATEEELKRFNNKYIKLD